MAQAVSHWPLTAEAEARFQASSCKICVRHSGAERGFLRVLGYFLFLPFYQFSILIFTHTNTRHLPEGQFGKFLEPAKIAIG